MEYVFVGGKPNNKAKIDYTFESINQSKTLLVSLINVLNSGNFYPNHFYDSLNKHFIDWKFKSHLKTFIDSGGYSIIVGDVLAQNVSEFIDKYLICAEIGLPVYDHIFSLDIPIFLKQPNYNSKQHIEEFNRISLTKTFNLVKNNEDFSNKLYFIWQFKIQEQYDVWSKLYDELKLNDNVKARALGGMVGLRGITQIDFSPFIGPSYRLLLDYIEGDTSVPFKMHCLGIYIQHDRFFLILLEKIFNVYLQRQDSYITYDSVNYMRTAQLFARKLPIWNFDNQQISQSLHINVSDDILRQVYNSDTSFYGIKEELERVKNGINLLNIDAFTPLNIYSNKQLDKYFEYIIDKYNIVYNIFHNPMRIKHTLDQIGSSFPNIFTPSRIRSIRANFNKLLPFHHWFMKDRNRKSLDDLLKKFIKDINFPSKLSDISEDMIDYDNVEVSEQNTWSKLSNFNQFKRDEE